MTRIVAEIVPGRKPPPPHAAGAGASFKTANRRPWIPACQLSDRPEIEREEAGERVWDRAGCWLKELPAPAPSMICVNDGSGVFWRLMRGKTTLRIVEQRDRAGAWDVGSWLYGDGFVVARA